MGVGIISIVYTKYNSTEEEFQGRVMSKLRIVAFGIKRLEKEGYKGNDWLDAINNMNSGLFDKVVGEKAFWAGYEYEIQYSEGYFWCAASPMKGEVNANEYYYIDSSGILRKSKGKKADFRSSPME